MPLTVPTDRDVDVACMGNALVDVLTHADDAFLDEHDLVKGSMLLVDGERSDAIYSAMGPGTEVSGGCAANTSVGVVSFGGTAAFIGKVRDDQLGHVYAHDLRAAGVAFEVAPAPADDPDPTGRCLILVTPDGERTMNTCLGIAGRVGIADVDLDLVARSALVYVEGYLWDMASTKEAILAVTDAAHAAGTPVAFTMSDSFCVERHHDDFVALAEERIDVLFANEHEICTLYEVDDFDLAVERAMHRRGVSFLTRGSKGSVAVGGGEVHEVPVEPATRVDATGAGDLYAAGALYGLTRGADLATCGRLGSLAAAEVISHMGARPCGSLAAAAHTAGIA